jgi:hypothetical protein
MCRIFHDALPCLPLWTTFPHPRYPTLKGLVDRLNYLGNDYVEIKIADISIGLKVYIDHGLIFGTYRDHTITKINPDGTYNTTDQPHWLPNNLPLTKLKQKVIHILPSLLFIDNGIHEIEDEYHQMCQKVVNMVNINIPISIIGESREHCIVMGGLMMRGKKEDDVNVSNLTLRAKNNGGGGNFGGDGTIAIVDNEGTIIETIQEATEEATEDDSEDDYPEDDY